MGDGLKPRGKTGQSPREALPGVLGCPLQAPITKECTHDVHALLPLAVKYGAIQQAGRKYGLKCRPIVVTIREAVTLF